MASVPLGSLLVLALLWFVIFWVVGGVLFAIIGLVRFLRLNKNRFSCLFTLASIAAAFGASWMGILAAQSEARGCFVRANKGALTDVLPILYSCAYREILSSATLWFLLLMAAGIFIMFISRSPERLRMNNGNG